ncbi:MAG TPA: ABC transporter ATP-binding protein [bacterium]|nr:ABC transporter ATP-binding protein [bacterium]HPR86833.1 ABC transporter ATP-binding protein [bacterium]
MPPADQTRRFILYYLGRHKWTLVLGGILTLLTTGFQLVIPLVLRFAIEYAEWRLGSADAALPGWLQTLMSGYTPLVALGIFAFTMVGMTVLQGLFRYFLRMELIGMSRRVEYHLRNDYLRHLQNLPASFFQRHKTGDLMARATNDMEAVRSMLGPGIMYFATTIIVAIISIVLMAGISWRTTLWSLALMPVVAFIVYNQARQIARLFDKIQEQFSSLTAKVQENLSGIRVVKSYVQEGHEVEDFRSQSEEYIQRNLKLVKVRAGMWTSIDFLLGLTTLAALVAGGREVMNGQLSIGGLVAFLSYLAMLAWPMIALGWTLNMWQEGLASTARIMEIFREEPEILDGPETDLSITSLHGEIEFRNLSFAYSAAGPAILSNISLHIPAGRTVAIVGATGSGKSSLVNLIPRLYQAGPGQLLIDGHPVERIPLALLRRSIGMVPQETFLFSETLQENIAFGVEELRMAEIEAAAETSQIRSDFDQFPDGFGTVVGERGITLSGGQKQRTAISRAIIRQPRILILDDALSAVDTYTEEEILKRLRTIMAERTTILVSHRISTVRDADLIVVLKGGSIIEQGQHEELLAQKGAYWELYQRQMLEESLAEIS